MPTTHTNPPVTVESQLRDALDMILGDIDGIRRAIDAAPNLPHADAAPVRAVVAQWEAEAKGLIDAYNRIARRTGLVPAIAVDELPF